MPQTFSNALFLFKYIILLSLSESRAKESTEHWLNRLCLKKQCEVTTGAFLPSLERLLSAPELLSYVLVISVSQSRVLDPHSAERQECCSSPTRPHLELLILPLQACVQRLLGLQPAAGAAYLHIFPDRRQTEKERVRTGVTGLI